MAAHFHDDDLADCAWRASFTLKVPRDLRSGCYAVRLSGDDTQDRIPFFVRPDAGAQRARLAVLLPTLSYMAYANVQAVPEGPYAPLMRFPNRNPQPATQRVNEYLARNRMRSLYDDHDDGSGICMATMRRPMYSVRPASQEAWIDSPHQLPADLHLIDWLEEKGIEYDVLTDHDLHFEGADALFPYTAVLSGTHAEYWSAPMLDALEAYQHDGGRFVYLSGNGLYWVTALSEDGTLAEVRRMNGTRAWTGLPGEGFVSLSGEPGDTWRSRGRPPQRYVGVGFASQGFDLGRPYRRTEASYCRRARFIFEGVEEELIGDCPALVCRHGAASFEVDRVDHDLGTPTHALVLATATGFSDSYQGVVEDAPVMAPVLTAARRIRMYAPTWCSTRRRRAERCSQWERSDSAPRFRTTTTTTTYPPFSKTSCGIFPIRLHYRAEPPDPRAHLGAPRHCEARCHDARRDRASPLTRISKASSTWRPQ